MGISTGGPQALRALLPQLPAALPVPMAIVLHMPVGFTELYARKLDELSCLKVCEAADGMEMQAGLRCFLRRQDAIFRCGGTTGASSSRISISVLSTRRIGPSVDVLFQSAADAYHGRVLGIVMTGMGDDGREGAAWIKAKGGTIVTESEDSCVVYGMPRAIVEAGLSDRDRRSRPDGRSNSGACVTHKLLLVDDSGLARRSMRAMLEPAGFEVIEAEDGMAALERYSVDKPDLVILDLVMKGMYGLDVLAKLRELDPSARVVVVSADVQQSSQDMVHAAGRGRDF